MATQRYLKSEERREATVTAVIELAARHNPGEITTTQIAHRMGVTQGALFRHFSSKSAVWVAVMNWVSERLLYRVEKEAARAEGPIDALEAMFLAHIDFITEHPGVPRLLFGELQYREDTPAKKVVRQLLGRYAVVIETHVKRGQASGDIRESLAPSVVSGLFVGMIQGLVMQGMVSDMPARIVQGAPQVFDIFIQGIRA